MNGLLHGAEIRKLYGGRRIENIADVIKFGDAIWVQIREIDYTGRASLISSK